MDELDGYFNDSADAVKRIDLIWSDTNLDRLFDSEKDKFYRLKCRNCSGLVFEVLQTGDWETSARCVKCGMYYIVHTG